MTNCRAFALLTLAALSLVSALPTKAADPVQRVEISQIEGFEHLAPFSDFVDGLKVYKLETADKVRITAIYGATSEFEVRPVLNERTATSTQAAKRIGAAAAVNGGYFNLSNGESASYVFVAGKMVCDPTKNKALTTNPSLKPYLETIFNRSELRVVKNSKNETYLVIARHSEALKPGVTLVHSLQAGPRLLPDLTARQEAFLRTDSSGKVADSIGVMRKAARTAFGIFEDGKHFLLISVAGKGQDEFSSGLTLAQLAELFRRFGCTEAINFDGGTSTTMVALERHDDGSNQPFESQMLCGKTPETQVKSALTLVQQR